MNVAPLNTLLTPWLLALWQALAIGLLIGMERGWTTRDAKPGSRVAGFRTFGLLGLTGGVAGSLGSPVAVVTLLLVGALLLAGYRRQSAREDQLSATNALTGIFTFLLGMLATNGHPREALALAAVATLMLSMRDTIHRALRGMTETELRAAARFLLLTFLVLPLLPDRQMGPYEAWNPRQLLLVVVFASGLSFAGYVIARRIEQSRATAVTAFCGALISSTAVTLSLSRRLRTGSEAAAPLIGGIALASAVMFARVMLLTGVLAPFALASLAVVIVPALLVSLASAAWLLRRPIMSSAPPLTMNNPLDLRAALVLGGLVALIALLCRWALAVYGNLGIAAVLTLTGMADVDAAVLAMGSLPSGTVAAHTAGLVLAAPVLANTLLKAAMAAVIAFRRGGGRAALPLLASIAAAGVAATLLL